MEIKFNFSEVDAEIKAAIKKMEAVDKEVSGALAEDIITVASDKLMQESVKRTPIDEGFLVASHKREVDKTNPSEIVGHVFIPANSPASDYALPIHEGEYNLGEKSLQKQATSDVTVGRKFLERALFENLEKFNRYILSRFEEYFKK